MPKPKTALRQPIPDSGPDLTIDEVEALIALLDGKKARKRLERQFINFIPF